MSLGIRGIEKGKFNKSVKIRFKNILEGFNNYKYKTLTSKESEDFKVSEKNFIKFMKQVYKLNKDESNNFCYIDFYLKDLNNEEYEKLLKRLETEEAEKLNYIRTSMLNNKIIDTIYFEVSDISTISLFTKMCTRELFFITFYFSNINLTVWGNYNLSFPIFYENELIIDKVLEIANLSDLNIK